MYKALITDMSKVLLFAKNPDYTGGLNELHEELTQKGDYDFWSYFEINQELLDFYGKINKKLPVHIFTSKYVQEYPPLKEKLEGNFSGILSAKRMGIHKSEDSTYEELAKQIGFQPEEILYVDDKQINVDAARGAGLDTIKFESNEQVMSEIEIKLSET